ncbi:MAG: L,D-transpeptidase family protein [Thermodesulfobacteriota bacterium]|nr:L,D-transpeptidase family protein [Thermodesulfobacteriota bacterium]
MITGYALAADHAITEIIRNNVEQIRSTHTLQIDEAQIASITVLPELYEENGFQRLWTNPKNVEDLFEAIKQIEEDGLKPDDYHFTKIEQLRSRIGSGTSSDPALLADFDLLLTDSLIRMGYHLIFGKVDPEDHHPHWNLMVEIDDDRPAIYIQEILDAGNLSKKIEELRPQPIVYNKLKSALKKYRAFQANGGWEAIPAGPTLKKGMQDGRVLLLRKRLQITGDFSMEASTSEIFDDALEQAVKRFQARHHLTTDGSVGKQTIEALNVPVENRIDQIRINLERLRWVLHAISGQFVIVDIAGFEVFVYQDNKIVWTSRVQVGRPYRQTPVFKSEITYLDLNPTWTIPPGILAKDTLPAVKKDRNYLKDRNIRVIDRTGKTVNQDTIDWSKYTGRNFPYQLRQDPGPDNAMGLIKIMFPNKHLVFIHDTPSKSLFERTDRTFSSGCIRTKKPFELAQILLDDPDKWNPESFKQAIDSGRTQTVRLPKPVPILLFYWTTAVEPDGTVRFKKDPYKRDAEVLLGLNENFKFRKRQVGQKRQTR